VTSRLLVARPERDDDGGMAAVARPLVGIIMGSRSDWDTMRHAADVLAKFGVAHEVRVVSAHRTPAWMWPDGPGDSHWADG